MLSLALALALAQPFAVATPSPLVVWPAIKGQFLNYCGVGRPCSASDFFATSSTNSYKLPVTGVIAYCDFVGNCNWLRMTYSASNGLTVNNGGGGSAITLAGSNAVIQNSGNTANLDLTTASRAKLTASGGFVELNGSIARAVGGPAVTFEDSDGVSFVGVAAASLPNASGNNLYTDTNTQRIWFKGGTPSANTPWYPLSAGEHSVLERRHYMVDVGSESNSAPTFDPSPRRGASTVSMTVVDGAAAVGTVIGTTPYVTDVRSSVTTAVSGNISSAIASTPWIRLDHGPRWCQKVSFDTKSSIRIWLGMSAALPGATDTSASQNVSFRFSTAASDANWQACSRDGATQSCTDTGISAANGTTAFQLLCIDCFESGACLYSVDGAVRVRKTTNLPVATTLISNYWSVETLSAAARTLYAGTSSVDIR